MTVKQIRDIVLGPRQILLFDFENQTLAEQNQMMAMVAGHIEMHGTVSLGDLVKMAVNVPGWSEFKVLQHLFWLAHDLKLQFSMDQQIVPPGTAKNILIESAAAALRMRVVLNKPVEETVFCEVKLFFRQISDEADSHDDHDQAEFALRLLRRIRAWKNTLESCRILSQRPGFPGARDIDANLDIIESITAKLDPFSLIHTFYENTGKIALLVKSVKTLAGFYADHSDRWQMLVRFANESSQTMAAPPEDPVVAAAYQRFNRILFSPQPYDKVDEACRLLKIVKPHHDRIVEKQTAQCRHAALSKVESLIGKMKAHLQAHDGSEDLQNQSLYALRTKINCINAAKTIPMIKSQRLSAEETFEIFWEEVVEEAQKDG